MSRQRNQYQNISKRKALIKISLLPCAGDIANELKSEMKREA
jgi:hypothetical protein